MPQPLLPREREAVLLPRSAATVKTPTARSRMISIFSVLSHATAIRDAWTWETVAPISKATVEWSTVSWASGVLGLLAAQNVAKGRRYEQDPLFIHRQMEVPSVATKSRAEFAERPSSVKIWGSRTPSPRSEKQRCCYLASGARSGSSRTGTSGRTWRPMSSRSRKTSIVLCSEYKRPWRLVFYRKIPNIFTEATRFASRARAKQSERSWATGAPGTACSTSRRASKTSSRRPVTAAGNEFASSQSARAKMDLSLSSFNTYFYSKIRLQ